MSNQVTCLIRSFASVTRMCTCTFRLRAGPQEHNLADHSREMGNYFAERFRASQPARVRELRQVGLMIGIELKEKATPYLMALMTEGVLALSAGPTVIRLLPPLTISRDELDMVISKLLKVLTNKVS